VVVPNWEGRLQPLHAIYRRSVLPLLQAQLERGELRPVFLYEKVRTREIGESEIRRLDAEGLSFLNMNSPEDYRAALARWQESTRSSVTIELFGVARLLSKTTELSLPLPEPATLSRVFQALSERLPALVGRVISPEKDRLSSGYACNINGLDFVRDPGAAVSPGDKIFILSADAGG
jgi:hypothetical protein